MEIKSQISEFRYITLQETPEDLLPFVVSLEQDQRHSNKMIPYSPDRHREVLKDEDKQHLIIREKINGDALGFIILAGLKSPNLSLELRRIIISEKNRGFGRAAIRLIKDYCFKQLNFHRLWLDVFSDNERAIYLYRSEGFRLEGLLRECIKTEQGFRSLQIYALLAQEYC